MIYGIGSDIVAVERIRRLLTAYGDAFARRILAPEEWDAYRASANPANVLAKRFAAKEALAKALGTGLRHPVSLRNISISHNELGRPEFSLSPELAQLLRQRGVGRQHLSLSDEKDLACAFVVLEQSIGTS